LSKKNILLQLDGDRQPSVFDSVVAVDSGVDHLFRHSNVEPTQVQDLVHGTMFTRGPNELKHTAIFVGGSNVTEAEELMKQVKSCFFGPMRVSVMCDANGCNTTAAAAVLAAGRHLNLGNCCAAVLAGTGPVGQRVARLLLAAGAKVKLASRNIDRAREVSEAILASVGSGQISAHQSTTADEVKATIDGAELVVAAGAAGVELLSQALRESSKSLQVAIDLNAVPPLGLAGVDVMDAKRERSGQICYGAIGVGGTKMKIHQAAIAQLFTQNDLLLDVDEIYQLGRQIEEGH